MSEDQGEPTDSVAKIATALGRLLGGDYAPAAVVGEDAAAQRDRLNHRLVKFEMRRQHNIESVAAAAFDFAEFRGENGGEAPIDEDWLARFVKHVEDVGNPLMQEIWGQVLAVEASTPGSFGLGTLNTLAVMSADDTEIWARARRVAFLGGFLLKFGARQDFEPFGVGAADLARLRAIGLLTETDDLSVTYMAPTKGLTLEFIGANLIVRHPDSTLFTFPAIRIAQSGIDLLRNLPSAEVDQKYLTALGDGLKERGFDYRLRPA